MGVCRMVLFPLGILTQNSLTFAKSLLLKGEKTQKSERPSEQEGRINFGIPPGLRQQHTNQLVGDFPCNFSLTNWRGIAK